jgi:hypothetical protein
MESTPAAEGTVLDKITGLFTGLTLSHLLGDFREGQPPQFRQERTGGEADLTSVTRILQIPQYIKGFRIQTYIS